jgi:hypothetical protein
MTTHAIYCKDSSDAEWTSPPAAADGAGLGVSRHAYARGEDWMIPVLLGALGSM